jgi:hypothetical protein
MERERHNVIGQYVPSGYQRLSAAQQSSDAISSDLIARF